MGIESVALERVDEGVVDAGVGNAASRDRMGSEASDP